MCIDTYLDSGRYLTVGRYLTQGRYLTLGRYQSPGRYHAICVHVVPGALQVADSAHVVPGAVHYMHVASGVAGSAHVVPGEYKSPTVYTSYRVPLAVHMSCRVSPVRTTVRSCCRSDQLSIYSYSCQYCGRCQ